MDPNTSPTVDEYPRCHKCKKLLATKLTRPWSMRCPRCKVTNERNVGELGRRQGSIDAGG